MRELLKKLGFEKTDREYLQRAHEAFGDELQKIAAEFYSVKCENRNDGYSRAMEYGKRAEELGNDQFHKYTLHLLFWIYCVPLIKED